jgi:hypothetical protein
METSEQETPKNKSEFNVFEHTEVDPQNIKVPFIPPSQDILFFIKLKIDFPKALLKKLGEEMPLN